MCLRVQTRARRHHIEAARLALLLRALTALGQEQEPGSTGSEAGIRRGLGRGTLAIERALFVPDVP